MLGLIPTTISTWLSQGNRAANQVNGTSPSNLTAGSSTQSSIASTTGLQLGSTFENLISQISAANSANTNTPSSTSSSSSAQTVHGHHHGHGGGGLNALMQQLEELAEGSASLFGAGATGTVAGSSGTSSTATSATAGVSGVGSTPSASAASATNIEATLNQLLQNLKLAGSSSNVTAANSAATTQSSLTLAQRLAQQGFAIRAGSLLSAVV
jgi:hypothetical protein